MDAMAEQPTRDRILASALRLFAERGFSGTSVAAIEEAAGLSPGSGALYAHFKSKQEVLEAAVTHAMKVADSGLSLVPLLPLGDVRAELTLIARGALLLMSSWRDLAMVLVKEAGNSPALTAQLRDQVVERTYNWFADWLAERAEDGAVARVDFPVIAAVWIGGLIQYWGTDELLGGPPAGIEEDRFIVGWVDSLHGVLVPRSGTT
jgi:AcrR family transcriptional regulator